MSIYTRKNLNGLSNDGLFNIGEYSQNTKQAICDATDQTPESNSESNGSGDVADPRGQVGATAANALTAFYGHAHSSFASPTPSLSSSMMSPASYMDAAMLSDEDDAFLPPDHLPMYVDEFDGSSALNGGWNPPDFDDMLGAIHCMLSDMFSNTSQRQGATYQPPAQADETSMGDVPAENVLDNTHDEALVAPHASYQAALDAVLQYNDNISINTTSMDMIKEGSADGEPPLHDSAAPIALQDDGQGAASLKDSWRDFGHLITNKDDRKAMLSMVAGGGDIGTMEQPWVCTLPGCGRSFKQKSARDRHTAGDHLRMGQFKCQYCGKQYSRDDARKRHENKSCTSNPARQQTTLVPVAGPSRAQRASPGLVAAQLGKKGAAKASKAAAAEAKGSGHPKRRGPEGGDKKGKKRA